ncbi:hypothetical protein HDU96_007745 [Phlyctochytrium bullatum]|nr:hypothetical protein HDU96_007745 [Phlyctochytrium bullatum]
MPEAAPAAAAGGAAAQGQPQQQGGFASMLQSGMRMLMIYWAVSYFFGGGGGGKKTAAPVLDEKTGEYKAVPGKASSQLFPLWTTPGVKTDLYVYVSEDEMFSEFTDVSKLIWKESDITFGDLGDTRTTTTAVPFSKEVQNNGTLYAHLYLTLAGKSPNPKAQSYDENQTLYYNKLISRYHKKKKVVHKKKLVGDKKKEEIEIEPEEEDEPADELPIISYWWSNMTVALVTEFNPIPSALPPPVMKRLKVHESGVYFYPVFEVDDFWLMSEHLQPINETVSSGNLTLFFQPKSWWYHTLLCQFDENFRMQNAMMGVDQKETDEIKRMFLETNPILLAVTMFVSILHSVFDFLAFKNDIAFWQKKKDLDGMSFRAIILNVGFQLIIFLYLLDNDTSWMVLISNGVGLLIEAWKIQKTVIIKTKPSFPFVEFIDKYKPSKTARKTMKYDKIAFKYLTYVLYPLLFGYAIYSVYYEEHKSWYSYIVGTLVGFVYMFDDVIFLIYLYQRWIYPEDKKRRNEFGQVGEEGGDDDDDDDDDSDDENKDKTEAKSDKTETEKPGEKGVTSPDDEGLRQRKTGSQASAPAATEAKKEAETRKAK